MLAECNVPGFAVRTANAKIKGAAPLAIQVPASAIGKLTTG